MKRLFFLLLHFLLGGVAYAEVKPPVLLGLSAEYGVKGSHVAQSIEKGILLAIDEINKAGGVLGGRKLALETRDDRGVPARAVANFTELAANPDIVGVFCGRFSPVALEVAPHANRLGTLLFDPWAAADAITQYPEPNYIFRLSLTDSWAIGAMLDHARRKSFRKLALFLPNTAWGRSSEAAVLDYIRRHGRIRHETTWYNWGDTEFSEKLIAAHRLGADALLMVANESEGALIVQQMAALPADERIPIISHWGISGGDFATMAGPSLREVDFLVVQSFTFSGADSRRARSVAVGVGQLFGIDIANLNAQVGFAHAYDLTHLVALAIRKAGSAERTAVKAALEKIETYDGLVRNYRRPFAHGDHEALDANQAFMARFDRDGRLRRTGN